MAREAARFVHKTSSLYHIRTILIIFYIHIKEEKLWKKKKCCECAWCSRWWYTIFVDTLHLSYSHTFSRVRYVTSNKFCAFASFVHIFFHRLFFVTRCSLCAIFHTIRRRAPTIPKNDQLFLLFFLLLYNLLLHFIYYFVTAVWCCCDVIIL